MRFRTTEVKSFYAISKCLIHLQRRSRSSDGRPAQKYDWKMTHLHGSGCIVYIQFRILVQLLPQRGHLLLLEHSLQSLHEIKQTSSKIALHSGTKTFHIHTTRQSAITQPQLVQHQKTPENVISCLSEEMTRTMAQLGFAISKCTVQLRLLN